MATAMPPNDVEQFLQTGLPASAPSSVPPDDVEGFLKAGSPQAAGGGAPSTPPAAPASEAFGEAKHLGVLAGQGVAQGALGVLGIPAAIDRLYREQVQPHLPSVVSAPTNELLPAQNPPLIEPMRLANRLGLDTEQPSGMWENLLAAGARGLGVGIATLPLGGAAAPLTTLAAGVAGGVAGESARAAGAPPWAQFLAGVVPGLAMGGWSTASNAAKETAGATDGLAGANKTVTDLQNQLESARINNPAAVAGLDAKVAEAKLAAQQAVADATTKSAATRDAAKAAAEVQANNETSMANAAIEGIAGAHGASRTLQDAGTALQDAGREWLTKTIPGKQNSVWSPVNTTMTGVPTPLAAFNAALSDINSSAGQLEPLAKLLKPGLPAQLQTVFDRAIGSPSGKPATAAVTGPSSILDPSGVPVSKVLSPAEPAQPITWSDVQKLRSTLGDAMSNPATIRDVGGQNLARLYSAATQDMRNSALVHGDPETIDAFDAANAESKRLYGIAQGPLARVIGGPTADPRFDPEPGKVATSLLSGGRTGDRDIAALAGEGLPVGELAAAQLRTTPAGWQKLSPEAQATLVPDASARSAIDNSLTLASAAPQKQKAVNAAADAAHTATVATAKANADFGPSTSEVRRNALMDTGASDVRDIRTSMMSAKAAQAAAAARFAALPRDDHVSNLLQSIQSSHIGGAAGVLLSALKAGGLDFGDELTGGAAGEIAAGAAPYAYRGIRAGLSSPAGLVPPVAGGLGGTAAGERRR